MIPSIMTKILDDGADPTLSDPVSVPQPSIASMKQKLAKCGNLAELKQRLADFAKKSQKPSTGGATAPTKDVGADDKRCGRTGLKSG